MVESPEILHLVIEYIVLIIEIIVVIFIAGIVIITLADIFRSLISRLRRSQKKVHIRHIVARMLRGLLIVLDFLIAADLLETILDPTLEETTVLALIVILRILLSWSLSKEIEMSDKEESKE